MHITVSQKRSRLPVTVLSLYGKLDGSNYFQLIESAAQVYSNGARDLLIDLRSLTFLSSAGMAAIHKTALVFLGQPVAMEESGWEAYHAIDRDRGGGTQVHVKLLAPQPAVAEILYVARFDSLFEIHSDLEAALASY